MPIHPRVLSAAVAAPVVAQRAQPARRAPAPRAPQPQPQQDGDGPFDIIGLGQAVVDYSASVSDELLGSIELAKGGRRCGGGGGGGVRTCGSGKGDDMFVCARVRGVIGRRPDAHAIVR